MNSVLFRKPWSVPYLVQDLERARFGEAVGGELFALERVDLVAEPGEADFPSGRNEEKPWSVPGYSSAACVNRGLSQVILSMGQRSGNRGLSPVIYLVFIWYLFGIYLEETGVIGNCKRRMERVKTGGWRRHGIVRALDLGRLMGVPYYYYWTYESSIRKL